MMLRIAYSLTERGGVSCPKGFVPFPALPCSGDRQRLYEVRAIEKIAIVSFFSFLFCFLFLVLFFLVFLPSGYDVICTSTTGSKLPVS